MIVGAAGTGGDRELADVGLKNPVAWLVLGVLPLLCLIFLVGQHLYGAPVAAATMLSRVALLALPAFLGLALYRKTRQPVYGGPAILLLLASTFFLFSTLGLIYTPERWPLIHGPLPGIFAVSVLVDFMTYLSLSVVAGDRKSVV